MGDDGLEDVLQLDVSVEVEEGHVIHGSVMILNYSVESLQLSTYQAGIFPLVDHD